MDIEAVIETYVAAWHEDDEDVRRQALEESWADDAVYADPGGTIEGRDALIEHITGFHGSRPDVRIEVRSNVDAVGRSFRFTWATVDGSGIVLREGVDFGQIDTEGRIAFIVGFFGLLP